MKKFWIHINFIVILVAAILLELAMGVMYYAAHTNIQDLAERYFERETKVASLRASDYMRQVEVAVNNMTWVVQRGLNKPDSMIVLARRLVEYNPVICGAGVAFTPNYYPQKGYWYEPYAYRDETGKIKDLMLGGAKHDYTKKDLYLSATVKGLKHWCEPYMDDDGSHTMVTTYSAPVRDKNGKVVAVIDADMEIEGLKKLIDSKNRYNSMRSFLFSREGALVLGSDSTFFTSVKAIKESDDEDDGYVTMTDERGETMYVFYQRVAGPADWTMVNVCYENDIFRDIRKVRILLLIAVVAGLLILSFIILRAKRHLERLRVVNQAKERIDSELSVAKRIQESMLPQKCYQQDNVEISGELVPVREVGGDLYDYFIRDDKLFFCVGDVSGKGVAAAMLMAVIHSLFRAFSAHDDNPANIVRHMNMAACQRNETNMFVTMFIGVLDLPTGDLRYCNAGHDAPIIVTPGGRELLPVEANLPIGVFSDVDYTEQEVTMDTNSTIFLYTDGLTEAKNKERKMYGIERAKIVLTECVERGLGLSDILSEIRENVRMFANGADQSDDLTMLAIHYTSKG